MQVAILIFGQLADITGSHTITVSHVADTDQLIQQLYTLYPAIKEIPFAMAVNRQVITGNTILTDQSTIALLPPFSGG